MFSAALHGFVLALGLILPLGVQNVFVFNQGATHRSFARALPVILTASVADSTLILLAVLGISALVLAFEWVRIVLLIGGIIFLVYIGWITWNTKIDNSDDYNSATLWPIRRQIVLTLSLSFFNPHAIIDTVGVIGTSSLSYGGTEQIAFVVTCIGVSWLWFFALAMAGRFVGSFQGVRRVLNRVSAIIMWLSSGYLLYQLFV